MRRNLILILLMIFTGAAISAAETEAVKGENVVYRVGEEAYEGYFVRGPQYSPLIFLIHDWDGLTEYEIKRAHMLGRLGYSVFAADLFGQGVRPTEVTDKRQHTGELYRDRQKMRNLLNAARRTAQRQGADVENAVAMGYCFGGAAVLEWARADAGMKGYVTFHGGLETPAGQSYTQTKGDILVFHGTADSMITMQHFADLADELEAAGVDHEMITYGGADHAFTVFEGERYDEEADQRSWSRFNDFLERVLL